MMNLLDMCLLSSIFTSFVKVHQPDASKAQSIFYKLWKNWHALREFWFHQIIQHMIYLIQWLNTEEMWGVFFGFFACFFFFWDCFISVSKCGNIFTLCFFNKNFIRNPMEFHKKIINKQTNKNPFVLFCLFFRQIINYNKDQVKLKPA